MIDPLQLAAQWLPGNDDPARPLLTLSTIGSDGFPDARTLLLTGIDERGFVVNTDANSRKSAQLRAEPHATLTVSLPETARQLVVHAVAEQTSPDESARAYRARSPYLRRLAWLNTDALAQLSAPARRAAWAAVSDAHLAALGPPPSWIGFLLRPSRITFWTGDVESSSHRTEYTRTDRGWSIADLPG